MAPGTVFQFKRVPHGGGVERCGATWKGNGEHAMTTTIDAVFDGHVFLPTQPINLPPNTRVQLAIIADEPPTARSFLDVAEGLALEGPADWSLHLDAYLDDGKVLQ